MLEARTRLGLSQREVGDRSGLPYSNLARVETGGARSGLSVPNLIKLAVALNVSLDWLCGLTEDPTPAKRR